MANKRWVHLRNASVNVCVMEWGLELKDDIFSEAGKDFDGAGNMYGVWLTWREIRDLAKYAEKKRSCKK